MFLFFGGLFAAEPGVLIEVGKMCGAAVVAVSRFLVGELDAAEKLHQACFAVIASSHNVLENNSFYVKKIVALRQEKWV